MNENTSVPTIETDEEIPVKLITDFVCDVLKRPDSTVESCPYRLEGNIDHSEAAVLMAYKVAQVIGQSEQVPAGLYRFSHHHHIAEDGERTGDSSTLLEKLTAIPSIDVTGWKDETGDDLFGLMGFGNYDGDDSEYAAQFATKLDRDLIALFADYEAPASDMPQVDDINI